MPAIFRKIKPRVVSRNIKDVLITPSWESEKILIFRLGSLGDTVASLPCFHLIARVFPYAERWVCTNFPVSSKAPPLAMVLDGSGLVHGYIEYPVGLPTIGQILALRRKIMELRPRALIYLPGLRNARQTWRDILFFKACGVKQMVGATYRRDQRLHRWLLDERRYESEAERLARCVRSLGDARLDLPVSWDLRLNEHEFERARQLLATWPVPKRFFACSVGGKSDVQDWGRQNWLQLIRRLGATWCGYGLILIGAKEEFERSEELGQNWPGPWINFCGRLTPRESAALIRGASLFLGHDSGPMHLAAAVGLPCVAVFSAHNKPGVWFPWGSRLKIIYHQTECFGCGLKVCAKHDKVCIRSITVEEVLAAIDELLANPTTCNVEKLREGAARPQEQYFPPIGNFRR